MMRTWAFFVLVGAMVAGALGCRAAGHYAPQGKSNDASLFGGGGGGLFGAGGEDYSVDLPESPDMGKPSLALLTAVDARKIIYNGRFTVVVADVAGSLASYRQYAESSGGFMARATLEEITVRVPAARFDAAVAKLRELGTVTAQDISAVDVSEQYMDLELRLASARAALKRYTELLEKAETAADTLAVEKELQRVRLEVEQLEGQLKNLANQVAFATITVRFAQTAESPARRSLPFDWLETLGLDYLLP